MLIFWMMMMTLHLLGRIQNRSNYSYYPVVRYGPSMITGCFSSYASYAIWDLHGMPFQTIKDAK